MLARHFLGLCPTAQIADPADNIDETELFHACIRATESGLPLLMLVTGEPGDWVPELPDLATRVAAAQQMVINAPDMDMIEALLIRRLDELNVSITPDALTYVLTRAERSFLWVDRLCTVLANEQHGRGHSVNLRTVREMLLLDKQTGPHEFSISTV
jgi:chromosomal replication initiation ATPase DnaA